jgi:hypothetical protein
MLKLIDEKQTKWVVMAHDPASKYINTLKSKGFDFIVLPRYTYMYGIFPPALPPTEDVINSVRMHDCCKVLT